MEERISALLTTLITRRRGFTRHPQEFKKFCQEKSAQRLIAGHTLGELAARNDLVVASFRRRTNQVILQGLPVRRRENKASNRAWEKPQENSRICTPMQGNGAGGKSQNAAVRDFTDQTLTGPI
jgi:hypothetical protein